MIFWFVMIFICVLYRGKRSVRPLRASPLAVEFCIRQDVIPRLRDKKIIEIIMMINIYKKVAGCELI